MAMNMGDSTHGADFWDTMYNLRQQGSMCDINLLVNEEDTGDLVCIPAHKTVLVASSKFFRNCLEEGELLDSYNFDGITAENLQIVLDYMYRQISWGEVSCNQEAAVAAITLEVVQHDKTPPIVKDTQGNTVVLMKKKLDSGKSEKYKQPRQRLVVDPSLIPSIVESHRPKKTRPQNTYQQPTVNPADRIVCSTSCSDTPGSSGDGETPGTSSTEQQNHPEVTQDVVQLQNEPSKGELGQIHYEDGDDVQYLIIDSETGVESESGHHGQMYVVPESSSVVVETVPGNQDLYSVHPRSDVIHQSTENIEIIHENIEIVHESTDNKDSIYENPGGTEFMHQGAENTEIMYQNKNTNNTELIAVKHGNEMVYIASEPYNNNQNISAGPNLDILASASELMLQDIAANKDVAANKDARADSISGKETNTTPLTCESENEVSSVNFSDHCEPTAVSKSEAAPPELISSPSEAPPIAYSHKHDTGIADDGRGSENNGTGGEHPGVGENRGTDGEQTRGDENRGTSGEHTREGENRGTSGEQPGEECSAKVSWGQMVDTQESSDDKKKGQEENKEQIDTSNMYIDPVTGEFVKPTDDEIKQIEQDDTESSVKMEEEDDDSASVGEAPPTIRTRSANQSKAPPTKVVTPSTTPKKGFDQKKAALTTPKKGVKRKKTSLDEPVALSPKTPKIEHADEDDDVQVLSVRKSSRRRMVSSKQQDDSFTWGHKPTFTTDTDNTDSPKRWKKVNKPVEVKPSPTRGKAKGYNKPEKYDADEIKDVEVNSRENKSQSMEKSNGTRNESNLRSSPRISKSPASPRKSQIQSSKSQISSNQSSQQTVKMQYSVETESVSADATNFQTENVSVDATNVQTRRSAQEGSKSNKSREDDNLPDTPIQSSRIGATGTQNVNDKNDMIKPVNLADDIPVSTKRSISANSTTSEAASARDLNESASTKQKTVSTDRGIRFDKITMETTGPKLVKAVDVKLVTESAAVVDAREDKESRNHSNDHSIVTSQNNKVINASGIIVKRETDTHTTPEDSNSNKPRITTDVDPAENDSESSNKCSIVKSIAVHPAFQQTMLDFETDVSSTQNTDSDVKLNNMPITVVEVKPGEPIPNTSVAKNKAVVIEKYVNPVLVKPSVTETHTSVIEKNASVIDNNASIVEKNTPKGTTTLVLNPGASAFKEDISHEEDDDVSHVKYRRVKPKDKSFPDSNLKFKCPKCNKWFKNETGLANHNNYVHEKRKIHQELAEPVKCGQCGQTFKTNVARACHERKVHGVVRVPVCEICNKDDFKNLKEYKKHMKVNHRKDLFRCEECGATFVSREGWNIHRFKQHTNAAPTHVCDICGKKFVRQAELKAHLKVTHSERVHKCQLCECSFKHFAALKRHLESFHTDARTFKCAMCGKGFKVKVDLDLHMKRHMREDNPLPASGSRAKYPHGLDYPCPECGKIFKRHNSVQLHIDVVHKQKREGNQYVCTLCGKVFDTKNYLIGHINNIHTVKRFQCGDCQKCFSHKYLLVRHLPKCKRTSIHDKQFPCGRCAKRFTVKGNMKKHEHRCRGPQEAIPANCTVLVQSEDHMQDPDESGYIMSDMAPPEGNEDVSSVLHLQEEHLADDTLIEGRDSQGNPILIKVESGESQMTAGRDSQGNSILIKMEGGESVMTSLDPAILEAVRAGHVEIAFEDGIAEERGMVVGEGGVVMGEDNVYVTMDQGIVMEEASVAKTEAGASMEQGVVGSVQTEEGVVMEVAVEGVNGREGIVIMEEGLSEEVFVNEGEEFEEGQVITSDQIIVTQ